MSNGLENLRVGKLLELTEHGIYCPQAQVYIDPWDPVDKAVITHAHGDHARWGSKTYLCTARGAQILRLRMGHEANIQTLPFEETVRLNGVKLSFYPAGHILGSAQIRLEYGNEVAVISGDYKVEPDITCDPFTPIKCDTFVTESTFGLPIYNWQQNDILFKEINEWWQNNLNEGQTSIVLAYSLGKAQRLLAGIDSSIGPIAVHGSVSRLNEAYLEAGVALPRCEYITADNISEIRGKALVIAPPSVFNTPWLRKLAPYSSAFASGWMLVRGQRKRKGVDRGFVISDHADWKGLLSSIKETEANNVWVTHGFTFQLVSYLKALGIDAHELKTQFSADGESEREGELEGISVEEM